MKTDFAIFKNGDRQYIAQKGITIKLEKIKGDKGEAVTFNDVLLTCKEGKIILGQPTVKGALVQAKIIEQGRGKKIKILKFKAKSRYRRHKGHRQLFTLVEVTKI